MKRMFVAALSLAILAGTAVAQEGPPAGALNEADLRALIANKRLTFQDAAAGPVRSGGVAEYRANGAYLYTLGPNSYRGKWAVEGGRVCATTGRTKRCDWLTKEGDNFFLIAGHNRSKWRFTVENL